MTSRTTIAGGLTLICLLQAVATAQAPRREIVGHTDPVYFAQYSPNNRYIVTAGFDKTVRVWNASTLEPVTTFEGHSGIVLTAIFSPDSSLIASGSVDNTIKLWEVPVPDAVNQTRPHPKGMAAAAVSFDGDWAVTAGKGGRLLVHDLKNDRVKTEVPWTGGEIALIDIRRDNQFYAVGTKKGNVYVYKLGSPEPFTVLGAHRGELNGLAFAPNNAQLVTSGADGMVRRWPGTPPASRAFEPSYSKIVAAVLEPGGRRLVTAAEDKTAQVWDVNQGKSLFPLDGLEQPVHALAFAADGSQIAAGGDDKVVRLFKATDGKLINEIPNLPTAIRAIAFRPDNQQLAVGTDSGAILVIQMSDNAVVKTFAGHSGSVEFLTWSNDGKTLYSAGADKTVRGWNPESGEQTFQRETGEAITAFALDRRNGRLAFATDDQQITVTAPGTDIPVAVLSGHEKPVRTLDFSTDGAQLISASDDGEAIAWDVKTKQFLQAFVQNGEPLLAAAFRPDKKIVTVGAGTSIMLQQASLQWAVPSDPDGVTCLAISPNSDDIALGSPSGHVRVLDMKDARTSREFSGLEGEVRAVAYSPNSNYFAAAGPNQTITLWRVSSQQREQVITTPAKISHLLFSPDSKKLLVAGDDRILRSYNPAANQSNRVVPGVVTPVVQEFPAHAGDIVAIGISSDNKAAFSASDDGAFRKWTLASSDAIATLTGHRGQIYSLAFSPDSTKLASASSDKSARLWDVAKQKEIKTIATLDDVLYSIAYFPDGKTVAVAGGKHTLRRIDAETGRTVAKYQSEENSLGETIYTMSLSKGGSLIAAAGTGFGGKRPIWVWDASNVQAKEALAVAGDSIYRVEFNPSGKRLMAVSYNGQVTILDLAARKAVYQIDLPGVLYSGTYSPDGGRILLSTGANTAIEIELPENAR